MLSTSSMTSKFSIPVNLPCSQKLIRLYELNNRVYLTLSKYCQNNDFVGFLDCIKCCIPDFDTIDNIVDKIYALILFRSIFLGDEIQILNKDKSIIKMSLSTILNQLESVEDTNTYELKIDGFVVEFKPLSKLPGEQSDLYDCIESISLQGIVIEKDDINEVLNRLPVNVFGAINQKVIALYNQFNNTVLIPANDKVKLDALTLNLLSEQLQQFILSIYKTDLSNLLEMVFAFTQHFKNVDFFDISPLDSRVLESILHRELKEAKKASERQEHTNPLTPHL